MMVGKTITDFIGNTPLVQINKLNPNKNIKIFAKLEGNNPGGSIKDRNSLKMIEQAEKERVLTKDKIIIEPTSGNTGIGLAMVSSVKGYQLEIVMSEAVSIERRKMLQAFGVNLRLTPAELGTDGAILKARDLVRNHPNKYFMPDQFSNHYNKLAHYETTAREIINQTNGKINFFVSAIGTSGTIMGVGKYLKEFNQNIKIICAHPTKGHYIQGLKNMEEAIVPSIYDPSMIDEQMPIHTEEAFKITRLLAEKEGIFAGMSSGAAMLAAIKTAEKTDHGVMVVIFPDRGDRYLSTNLFQKDKDKI